MGRTRPEDPEHQTSCEGVPGRREAHRLWCRVLAGSVGPGRLRGGRLWGVCDLERTGRVWNFAALKSINKAYRKNRQTFFPLLLPLYWNVELETGTPR